MSQALPQDFVKFGLIPEFVGRVPVSVSLDQLDVDMLVRVLTEPKSAIIKQYKKLFEMDGVDLVFEDEAIRKIAELSAARNTGARGLRAIVEDILMDIMFTIPSDESVTRCIITKDVVAEGAAPVLEHGAGQQDNTRGAGRRISGRDEIA